MVIRKLPNQNKWRLYSEKTHKKLGTFQSRESAIKREMQINFFKYMEKRKRRR
jgi:hypothetical protein